MLWIGEGDVGAGTFGVLGADVRDELLARGVVDSCVVDDRQARAHVVEYLPRLLRGEVRGLRGSQHRQHSHDCAATPYRTRALHAKIDISTGNT